MRSRSADRWRTPAPRRARAGAPWPACRLTDRSRPRGGAGELRGAVQQEAGAAAHLEHVFPVGVALDQLDLQIVEHPVIGQVPLVLVPAGEVVVVGAVIEAGHRRRSTTTCRVALEIV